MRRERIELNGDDYPALAFVAARRVQSALCDQPPFSAVTAAKLVSEIIQQLSQAGTVRQVSIEITRASDTVRLVIRSPNEDRSTRSRLDGMARLLLDRLAANWGEELQETQVWFELTTQNRAVNLRTSSAPNR